MLGAWRYRTTLRPAGFGGMPAGVRWEYVEAPPDLAGDRPDLPRSSWRYGVVSTDRALTAGEMAHFDIVAMPDR